MKRIDWSDFEKIELRAGTVVRAEEFPEARKPALKLWVDFGGDIGTLRSSAQIKELYTTKELLGRQVICVLNFAPKLIGPFLSECLVTGLYREDGSVVLAIPDKEVQKGARLG